MPTSWTLRYSTVAHTVQRPAAALQRPATDSTFRPAFTDGRHEEGGICEVRSLSFETPFPSFFWVPTWHFGQQKKSIVIKATDSDILITIPHAPIPHAPIPHAPIPPCPPMSPSVL